MSNINHTFVFTTSVLSERQSHRDIVGQRGGDCRGFGHATAFDLPLQPCLSERLQR